MIKTKHKTKPKPKTDYQLLADKFKVSVWAVKQALKTRERYPNNRLVIAYDKLQGAKLDAVANMTTTQKMNAKRVAA